MKKLNAAIDRPRDHLENVVINYVPLKSLINLPDLSMAAMLLLRLVKLVRPWPCDTTNWKLSDEILQTGYTGSCTVYYITSQKLLCYWRELAVSAFQCFLAFEVLVNPTF